MDEGFPSGVQVLGQQSGAPVKFTVATLVTDPKQYRRMHASFVRHGWNAENSEFIVADNRVENGADGFDGLRRLIASARGEYVICCHQDVELCEDMSVLLDRLAALQALDPFWAVVGNAGICDDGASFNVLRTNSAVPSSQTGLPAPVSVLDENFLLLRREAMIAPSSDLKGFHHYGADVCLQARSRGWRSYVVDFQMMHHGLGAVDERYFDSAEALEAKYARLMRTRRLPTLFRALYLTGSQLLGPIYRQRAMARRRKWLARRKRDA